MDVVCGVDGAVPGSSPAGRGAPERGMSTVLGRRRGEPPPRLLLVAPAGSYRVGDLLVAARGLGCDVTVVTDAAVAIAGAAIVTSLTDPVRAASAVLAVATRPVDGVIGTDGPAVAVAGEIARRLGLPSNSPGALRTAADKLAQRVALARADVDVRQPAFAVLPGGAMRAGEADATARREVVDLLPAVVKPVDRTASQGVLAASTAPELRTAVARARRLVGADAPLIVERFVPGNEVAVDALLCGGQMQVLAVFDKPDTPTGPTFPETLLISPGRLPRGVEAAVCDVVERAARAIGLTEGAVHAECKVDGDQVWFLEIAARSIGGLCGRSLRIGGSPLAEVVVRHALRMPVPAGRATDASGVLMLPVPAAGRLVAVRGVERARAIDGVTDVVISVGVGETVTPLPDGDRYLGFVFARCATADGCERALRAARAALQVEIDSDGPDASG